MAHILGTASKVAISSDGSTYVTIGDITTASLSMTVNSVDITDNDSSAKEFMAGDATATFTFTFNYEGSQADGGQEDLIDAFIAKTTMYFRLRPRELTGESQYVFQGIVTELPIESSHEEVITMTATVQVTGAITESAQS
jgi:predicted secreted protein